MEYPVRPQAVSGEECDSPWSWGSVGSLIVLITSMAFFVLLIDRGFALRDAALVTAGFVLAWRLVFGGARGMRTLMKAATGN